jgi:hypothetical protein
MLRILCITHVWDICMPRMVRWYSSISKTPAWSRNWARGTSKAWVHSLLLFPNSNVCYFYKIFWSSWSWTSYLKSPLTELQHKSHYYYESRIACNLFWRTICKCHPLDHIVKTNYASLLSLTLLPTKIGTSRVFCFVFLLPDFRRFVIISIVLKRFWS